MSPKKVDANQPEIVKQLRQCGLHVIDLHTLGKGVPDILVTGYSHAADKVLCLLVEVKGPNGKLTPDEAVWHEGYPQDGPLIVAHSADEVLWWFGIGA